MFIEKRVPPLFSPVDLVGAKGNFYHKRQFNGDLKVAGTLRVPSASEKITAHGVIRTTF